MSKLVNSEFRFRPGQYGFYLLPTLLHPYACILVVIVIVIVVWLWLFAFVCFVLAARCFLAGLCGFRSDIRPLIV